MKIGYPMISSPNLLMLLKGEPNAIMTFTDGKWYAVAPKSVLVRMTEMAILEKAHMSDGR